MGGGCPTCRRGRGRGKGVAAVEEEREREGAALRERERGGRGFEGEVRVKHPSSFLSIYKPDN